MADKKKGKLKKDKPSSASANKEDAPSEYDDMNIELIREIIPRLKAQLEKTALDRNYAQLERDAIQSYYSITKQEVIDADLTIAAKERELESFQKAHKIALHHYSQKEKQLEYKQFVKLRNMDQYELYRSDRPLGLSSEAQVESVALLADKSRELETALAQIESTNSDHLVEVKEQYDYELAQLSIHFQTEIATLKTQCEMRSQQVESDEEVRRRVGIHDLLERRNSHINELVHNHKLAYQKLKSYYESVNAKDKKVISGLHEDIKNEKTRLDGVKQTLADRRDTYTRLTGLSASEAAVSLSLQQQEAQQKRSDVSFKNARLRESDLKKKIARMQQNVLAMELEYDNLRKECVELSSTENDILDRTMAQSNQINESLERKLRRIEQTVRGGIVTSSDMKTPISTSIEADLSLLLSQSDSLSAEDVSSLRKTVDENSGLQNSVKAMSLSTIAEDRIESPRSFSLQNSFSDSIDSLCSPTQEPVEMI